MDEAVLGFLSCLVLVMCGGAAFFWYLEKNRKVITVRPRDVPVPISVQLTQQSSVSREDYRKRVASRIGRAQLDLLEKRLGMRVSLLLHTTDGGDDDASSLVTQLCNVSSGTHGRVNTGRISLADDVAYGYDKQYQPMPLVAENRRLLERMGFTISNDQMWAVFHEDDAAVECKEEVVL